MTKIPSVIVIGAGIGGIAALTAQCIKKVELIAYEDLGTEAIRKLYVEDFPLIVVNDIHGGDDLDTFILKLNLDW